MQTGTYDQLPNTFYSLSAQFQDNQNNPSKYPVTQV